MITASISPDAQELPDVRSAIERVVASGHYVLGPEVADFEREWADYCGARHCVGVASGTDALKLLLSDLPRDGRVLVPANTAPPTYVAINEAGLAPWFVDIGDDGLVDPAALPKQPGGAVALLPVHLYGRMARMALLADYATRHGLRLIEDACQAHGARDVDGLRPGEASAGAAFSFYPTKNLAALGDGGAVVTNDDGIAERVRCLRGYGYVAGEPGVLGPKAGCNSRLDELQAAILRARLPHLERRNGQRRRAAERYCEILARIGVKVFVGPSTCHHLLAVRVLRRDAVRRDMAAQGVATAVHYPVPGHHQAPFSAPQHLPRAERWCAEILSLPLWPGIDEAVIQQVGAALRVAVRPLGIA